MNKKFKIGLSSLFFIVHAQDAVCFCCLFVRLFAEPVPITFTVNFLRRSHLPCRIFVKDSLKCLNHYTTAKKALHDQIIFYIML